MRVNVRLKVLELLGNFRGFSLGSTDVPARRGPAANRALWWAKGEDHVNSSTPGVFLSIHQEIPCLHIAPASRE